MQALPLALDHTCLFYFYTDLVGCCFQLAEVVFADDVIWDGSKRNFHIFWVQYRCGEVKIF